MKTSKGFPSFDSIDIDGTLSRLIGREGISLSRTIGNGETVVIDLQVPIREGVELVRHVSETCPDASIVARIRLRSGELACFGLEVHEDKLRLVPDRGESATAETS